MAVASTIHPDPTGATAPAANGLLCVRCVGHSCQANRVVDGEALCIWCLDDLPCPYARKNILPKGQTCGGRAPLRRVGAQSQGGISPPALLRKSQKTGARKMNGSAATRSSKPNGHALDTPRVCKCGCGEVVPPDFRFSYLPKHRHTKKRAASRPGKKAARRVTSRAKRSTIAAGISTIAAGLAATARDLSVGRCQLQVSEQQLDRFLTRLPFADKQHLANYYLMQVDVA